MSDVRVTSSSTAVDAFGSSSSALSASASALAAKDGRARTFGYVRSCDVTATPLRIKMYARKKERKKERERERERERRREKKRDSLTLSLSFRCCSIFRLIRMRLLLLFYF
jgi:ribosomal protein L9